MKFGDILNDIEKLVGLTLRPITPTTPEIVLIRLDRVQKRYILQIVKSGKEVSRPFKELMDICNNLVFQGYINIDQVLFGSGSSRNQPETLIANLPYIEHFKYDHKKHLLLRNKNTHEFGTLQALSDSEQRNINKLIDNQRKLDIHKISSDFETGLASLSKSIAQIIGRYPGDESLGRIKDTILGLKEAQNEIASSIVRLDEPNGGKNIRKIESIAETIRNTKLDLLIDLPIYTGVDDGKDDDIEEEEDSDTEKNESMQSSEFVEATKLNFKRLTPTFQLIYDRLRYKEIDMQPDYQRKDGIWSPVQKSKLVESILMGLPLPIFYFGERSNGNWVIIDGLQRLTTIQDFMSNEFKLTGLTELKSINDFFFKDLDRFDTRKIRETEITAWLVDIKEGTEKLITELFHRINTYGVKLSNQEIRTAINLGSSVHYLKYLATRDSFLSATNEMVNSERQKDLELCLAAISYMLFGYKDYKYGKYDQFLSAVMKSLNKEDFIRKKNDDGSVQYINRSPLLMMITERFTNALEFSKEIFEEAVFKKFANSEKTEPLSKPLFELVIAVFSNLTPEQMNLIRLKKETFLELFFSAIEDNSTDYATWESSTYESKKRGFNAALSESTGKRVTILYRFDSFLQIIKKSTGCEVVFTPILEIK